MGDELHVASLHGCDVVFLDGNLVLPFLVDDGGPLLSVAGELDDVVVNLVDAALGTGVAVVNLEAVDAVGTFAVEDDPVVGAHVTPLLVGLRGVGDAVDDARRHLGRVGRATVVNDGLSAYDVVDLVKVGLRGHHVERLEGGIR